MKYLLTCLLFGSLLSPALAQEDTMTFEEFVQKIGKANPWTLEKVEAELGVKFTYTSSTGYRHVAYEPLPSVKDLDIQSISLYISKNNNETLRMHVNIDSKLSCFTLENVKALYPGGIVDSFRMNPGGGVIVYQ